MSTNQTKTKKPAKRRAPGHNDKVARAAIKAVGEALASLPRQPSGTQQKIDEAVLAVREL